MNKEYLKYIEQLNHSEVNIRLESLKKLKNMMEKGEIEKPKITNKVNNHIHTIYSFSPYSPSKAIWMSCNSGLATAGLMDHDSLSGAEEFIQAGKIMGIATTIGVECRVDFSDTPLNGKRINNPDQKSIAYVALHGIPHTQINKVKDFFIPYNKERNKRNRSMVQKINEILLSFNISLDFENDVIPLSKTQEGGSITERHVLFALSKRLVDIYGKGEKLLSFIKNNMGLIISEKSEQYLLDINNIFYEYDLLAVLKSDMVSKFYIDADKECPDVKEIIKLSNNVSAISAYAYLGDIEDSITGDKKSQKFEDEYLELLFKVIKDIGFNAVTYMPSRNSMKQLKRLKALCEDYELFQISGEDINSPRQSFICEALEDKEFSNLIDAAWALIGHEILATDNINNGMFSQKNIAKYPDINKRINYYKSLVKD